MAKDIQILKWGMGISWFTSCFLIIPISIIALIVTIYKLYKRKSKFTKYAIILNPFLLLPITNIGMGISDYSNGIAKIKSIGYPAPEFANIDNEYRVEHFSLGCTPTGTEYLTSFRYNQTVKFLINRFGFQKDSYTGIIPTKAESKEFLLDGEFGKVELFEDGIVKIENSSHICQIDVNKQHDLVKMTINESEMNPFPRLKIVDDCLISQLNHNWIYLIELKRNKVIAQYRI